MKKNLNAFWHGMLALCVLATVSTGERARAQTGFGLSVTSGPSPVTANVPINYLIIATNQSAFPVSDVFISNRFSAPITFLSSTNLLFSFVETNSNTVVFRFNTFPGGTVEFITFSVRATTFGNLTNTITSGSFFSTNVTVTTVTEVIAGQPDLAVSARGPTLPVLEFDLISYRLTVTNQGGDNVAGVVLTNAIPPDVQLIEASSGGLVAASSNLLVWNLGTMAIGSVTNLNVTVQPTNTGDKIFSAGVNAPNVVDVNLTNNLVSLTIPVSALEQGSLVASNVSEMTLNRQTGLMEQTIRLVNTGSNSVPAARVIVADLEHRLFNAVGTNGNDPFVVYAATLNAGQSVDLLLEYFVPDRTPFTVEDSQLEPFVMPEVNLTPPTGTVQPALRIVALPSGRFLVEFETVLGRDYAIVYADNASLSNAQSAHPIITGTGNRVHWIDDGPPKTVSAPMSVNSRFYGVIQLP